MGALTISQTQTEWTIEQLRALSLQQVPTQDLLRFLHICQKTDLDPFARQIYMQAREDKRTGDMTFPIFSSIDGFRIVAQRSHEYEGQTDIEWCGPDGVWTEVWLDPTTPPAAARAGVWRKGFRQPLKAVALWKEYGSGYANWRTMPALMLAKCAEALALRRAFPQDLSGIYTQEEMDQAVTQLEAVANKEEPEDPEKVWDEVLGTLSRASNDETLAAAWRLAGQHKLHDAEAPGEGKPYRELWTEAKNRIRGLGETPGEPAVAPPADQEYPYEIVRFPNGEVDQIATLRNRVTWQRQQKELEEQSAEAAEKLLEEALAAQKVEEEKPDA